ncbi:MAG: FAD-dependent oxidoreductase [Elusimicrobiota bacterium]
MTKPKIVIIGAGFGGLEAARALRKADAEITVVDRHNHHTFQPLLYQVATAGLSPADIAYPIRAVLSSQANANVLLAEAVSVDVCEQPLHAAAPSIPRPRITVDSLSSNLFITLQTYRLRTCPTH